MIENCLTYAVSKYIKEGGYILMRRSLFSEDFDLSKWHPLYWMPHFLHRSKDKVITQYSPTDKQRSIFKERGIWYTWLHLWHIQGYIRGDDI